MTRSQDTTMEGVIQRLEKRLGDTSTEVRRQAVVEIGSLAEDTPLELIIRALVKAKMAGLANIILDEMIMPELLQRQATAKNLADALVALVHDSPERRRQCEAFAKLDTIMEVGGRAPSERAAAIIIALARNAPQRHPAGVLAPSIQPKRK